MSQQSINVADKLHAHWESLRAIRDRIESVIKLHPAVESLSRAMRAIDDATDELDDQPLEI